jgi:hypothetical protein
MHRSVPACFALLGTALLAAPFALPQELPPQLPQTQNPPSRGFDPGFAPTLPPGISADGNRWVEVEMTVFRAETNRSNEVANPGRLKLSYFPNSRPLASPLDSYAYPFEADQPPAPSMVQPATPQQSGPQPLGTLLAQNTPPPEEIVPPEPMYDFTVAAAPGVPGSFKVLDLARDPYVRLDAATARFSGMDRNLEQSPDYQVLWHEVWRQPLLDRGAVSAVVVQAGETLGEHTALEGSLRLSGAGDRAHLDLNLWLSEFGVNDADDAARWQVPVVPEAARPKQPESEPAAEAAPTPGLFPSQQTPPQSLTPAPERGIVRIWQLLGAEDMALGELRYLDHPVLGVLIEARPYLLPEAVTPGVSEDF